MEKHLEFRNGQWCVVDQATGNCTGRKTEMQINLQEEQVQEERFCSQVYIESFTFNTDVRPVYPYKMISPMGIRQINFAPITILYGSNGSGKSTLLNVIASRIKIDKKTEGNTNAYFSSYVEKCSYQIAPFSSMPDDSVFVRSEDILDGIMKGRKRYSSAKKIIGKSASKSMPESPNGCTQDKITNLLNNPDKLSSSDRFFLSRCSGISTVEEVNGIADMFESNGEVALKRMQEIIMPDSLCFLDEPEVSLSPIYQKKLANMIEIFATNLRTQFVIATHSPFFLSMNDARIYDLDSRPAQIRQWQDLQNMRVYFELFEKNKEQFTAINNEKEQ